MAMRLGFFSSGASVRVRARSGVGKNMQAVAAFAAVTCWQTPPTTQNKLHIVFTQT